MLPFAALKCGKTVVFNCNMHELFSKPVPAGLNSSVGTLTAGTFPIISTGLTFTIAEPSCELHNLYITLHYITRHHKVIIKWFTRNKEKKNHLRKVQRKQHLLFVDTYAFLFRFKAIFSFHLRNFRNNNFHLNKLFIHHRFIVETQK